MYVCVAKIDAHLRKNRLKRPNIKQGTTSKVNCILFNRLLNLLNKSGLVRAKASNFNLKSLNRCFSNYYQVRTWPVFAKMVTYITIYCNKQYIDIFIRCIVLYCSNEYCNISIYCNIVISLQYINISMHQYSICSIDMYIETLRIAIHQCITVLSHL